MTGVTVIGGGFAGLAAAVSLAGQGLPVTVLESRARLGGRAYSFRDQATGVMVDNGQHAMMGCYEHALAFLHRIGAAHKLVVQRHLKVPMVHERLGVGAVAFPALPGPAHAAVGILRYRLLPGHERARILLGGLRLMARHRARGGVSASLSLAELLSAVGQTAQARARFWDPIAVATLNEIPERAAARPFVEVLSRAFFGSPRASCFILPGVELSELYTEDARRFIEEHGGRVLVRAGVERLEIESGKIVAACLRDGRRMSAACWISALPPRALERILPEDWRRREPFSRLGDFGESPIVSTHLWFDREVLDEDFAGLLGVKTQFLFNRSRLIGRRSGSRAAYEASAVISAAREWLDVDPDRITEQVVGDVRRLLPAGRAARVLRAVVVKERRATVSLTPEAERRRPDGVTSIENLFLAGDWVATGLPATIESAVSSGDTAAALAVARLSRHRDRFDTPGTRELRCLHGEIRHAGNPA